MNIFDEVSTIYATCDYFLSHMEKDFSTKRRIILCTACTLSKFIQIEKLTVDDLDFIIACGELARCVSGIYEKTHGDHWNQSNSELMISVIMQTACFISNYGLVFPDPNIVNKAVRAKKRIARTFKKTRDKLTPYSFKAATNVFPNAFLSIVTSYLKPSMEKFKDYAEKYK